LGPSRRARVLVVRALEDQFSFSLEFLTELLSRIPSTLVLFKARAATGTVVRASTFACLGAPSGDLNRATDPRPRGGEEMPFANPQTAFRHGEGADSNNPARIISHPLLSRIEISDTPTRVQP